MSIENIEKGDYVEVTYKSTRGSIVSKTGLVTRTRPGGFVVDTLEEKRDGRPILLEYLNGSLFSLTGQRMRISDYYHKPTIEKVGESEVTG